MTEKRLLNMKVTEVATNDSGYAVLRLRPTEGELPELKPGQFVNILVESVKEAFLRRPISVHDVDGQDLILMVKNAGPGTDAICSSSIGDTYNVLLPLGHGFSFELGGRMLLIGGGVGIAPLLYLGRKMKEADMEPHFLLGARTASDLMNLDAYKQLGPVAVSTEDGSMGERGFVTAHPVLGERFDRYAVCGPMPMMKAVAKVAREKGVECEVSLENKMACGLGACLCCVEDTVRGNECTCTKGPVYNLTDLKW